MAEYDADPAGWAAQLEHEGRVEFRRDRWSMAPASSFMLLVTGALVWALVAGLQDLHEQGWLDDRLLFFGVVGTPLWLIILFAQVRVLVSRDPALAVTTGGVRLECPRRDHEWSDLIWAGVAEGRSSGGRLQAAPGVRQAARRNLPGWQRILIAAWSFGADLNVPMIIPRLLHATPANVTAWLEWEIGRRHGSRPISYATVPAPIGWAERLDRTGWVEIPGKPDRERRRFSGALVLGSVGAIPGAGLVGLLDSATNPIVVTLAALGLVVCAAMGLGVVAYLWTTTFTGLVVDSERVVAGDSKLVFTWKQLEGMRLLGEPPRARIFLMLMPGAWEVAIARLSWIGRLAARWQRRFAPVPGAIEIIVGPSVVRSDVAAWLHVEIGRRKSGPPLD